MGGVFTKYPAMRYHKELAPEGLQIRSPEAEAELAPGWVDTPAKFDPAYRALTEDPPEGTPFETYVAPAKPPIPYPAVRYAQDGSQLIVHSLEEDEALNPAIWKDTPDPTAWLSDAAVPVDTDAPDQMHTLTVSQIGAVLETVTDPAELDDLETREYLNPKGARKGVLVAITTRREALIAKA